MLRPDDELPPAATIRPAAARLLPAAALLLGTLAMAAIAVGLFRLATTPLVISSSRPDTATSTERTTSGIPASPLPDVLLVAAAALATSLAPTPSPPPPTPTYVMLPTPMPANVCFTATPKGELCTQPKPPLPPPTPIPMCPVSPGQPCLGQGGPVTWLPSPTPSQYSQVGN